LIDLSFLSGSTFAVLGLGRSGLAAALALLAGGATVAAWDDDEARRRGAADAGVPLVDLAEVDWDGVDALVLSPGIPHTHPAPHPVAAAARAAGRPVIGDIELLARAAGDAAIVGVTGTNGKSTTTALLGHVLRAAGVDVEVGGNIGTPVADFRSLGAGGVYVLELSSYQLELVESLSCRVAVLLNISPDHLDRHGGIDGYVAAKKRIFHANDNRQTAVVGVDDAFGRAIAGELAVGGHHRVVPISGTAAVPGGVFVRDGVLMDDMDGGRRRVLDLGPVATLRGAHNHQNAAAAYAVARAVDVAAPVIAEAIASFPGLAHRQELVAVVDGIAYVNDSKATNAEAAARALASYPRIFWIAGGRAKEAGIDALVADLLAVRRAFLIGEAADGFAATLTRRGVPNEVCRTLERAVARAREAALAEGPGGTVLLSPACASFDQFVDFEDRGDTFRTLVEALPGNREDGVAEAAGGGAP
jgi:UDP-N-acetylmuramoylalanine--D-glutamate ligase